MHANVDPEFDERFAGALGLDLAPAIVESRIDA